MNIIHRVFLVLLVSMISQATSLADAVAQLQEKKILVVVTSNAKLKNGQAAGYYLPELVDFYNVIREHGLDTSNIDVISPKGGKAPMYRRSTYLNYYAGYDALPELLKKVDNTLKAEGLVSERYSAVYYVGGFASLFDLPNDTAIGALASSIYNQGGVLSAVCHGPSGLLALKHSDGSPLIASKNITTRSWEEESGHDQITRDDVLAAFPFILFEQLESIGAKVEFGPYMSPFVVRDGRIVTGQNENSATGVAEAVIELMTQMSVADDRAASPIGVKVSRIESGLKFTLDSVKHIMIELIDMLGRTQQQAGAEAAFHGLAPGCYFARVMSGGQVQSLKVRY